MQKKFAEEMITSGMVDAIRNENGNQQYEYFWSTSSRGTPFWAQL